MKVVPTMHEDFLSGTLVSLDRCLIGTWNNANVLIQKLHNGFQNKISPVQKFQLFQLTTGIPICLKREPTTIRTDSTLRSLV